jgi:hypothetical protein
MGNEYEKQAKALNKMGDKMFKNKQYVDAIKYYTESIKMAEVAANPKLVGKFKEELDKAIGKKAEELNREGDQAYKNKDFPLAIKYYEQAWKMLQNAGEKWINKKAKEFQRELVKSKIAHAEEDLKPEAEALVDAKNWDEAVKKYQAILELVTKEIDAKMNSKFLHDLSTVYERWADDINTQGDEMYKQEKFEEAIELYSRAVVYIEKSDNAKKIKNYKKELTKAFEEHAQEINDMGDRLWKEKNYAKAAEIYAQSVKIAEEADNTKLVDRFAKEMNRAFEEFAKEINSKGDALFKEKKWEEAADVYAESVNRAVESGNARLVKKFTDEYEKAMERWADEVNREGDAAMKNKDFDNAMKLYEHSVAIIKRTKNESRVSNYTKEYHKACVKLADEINSTGDENYKADNFQKAFDLYDKSVKLAEIAGDSGRIKKYMKERNKALSKLDQ